MPELHSPQHGDGLFGSRLLSIVRYDWPLCTSCKKSLLRPSFIGKPKIRKKTGDSRFMTDHERRSIPLATTFKANLARPLILLDTQPIIQILGLYMAYIYNLYCKRSRIQGEDSRLPITIDVVLSDFSELFVQRYHEAHGISGLNYI